LLTGGGVVSRLRPTGAKMPISDGEEREPRIELMRADLDLKTKQKAWETPRNIAILAGTVAAIAGVLAGVAGYKIGQSAAPSRVVFQPGAIQISPPPAPPAR